MNDLEQFLALPDIDNITADVFVSDRVGTFKVKAMTAEEYRDYNRKSTGKFNKDGVSFDSTKFFISMIAGQTISPDFANKEALAKSKCITPEELVSKKLLIGEIMTLASKIQEISGFNNNKDEDIEDAKN